MAFADFLDGNLRCSCNRDHELAHAAFAYGVDRRGHRERRHCGCNIDAVYVVSADRTIPQRADHESGTAAGDDS